MSDLFEVREKTEKGAKWRGEIDVTIDDEHHSLSVRQLYDPEFWEVMSAIDMDELESLQSALPEEEMEEYEELQSEDELTDKQKERLAELEREVENSDINIFDALSRETYEGLKVAAKYGVEADESDIQRALTEYATEIEEKYGGLTHDDARQYLNDNVIAPMIDKSTDFTSFAIGVKVLGETLDDEGN
jgi:alanyl-tRNA synthetase